jgi:diadenosine tetraphosphatase ApaH/serine/threonine PP2A family protein phosphatase
MEAIEALDGATLVLDSRRVLANPGSVGQPRDGDSRASAAILDTSSSTLTWHRVAYPIAATQADIRARGLPGWLADRLAGGR